MSGGFLPPAVCTHTSAQGKRQEGSRMATIEEKATRVRLMAERNEIPAHLLPDVDGAMHYSKSALRRRSRRLYQADLALCEKYLDRILAAKP